MPAPTLTQTAVKIKLLLKWGSITIVILIGLWIIYKVGIGLYHQIKPPPPPPPTVAFGQLPPFTISLEEATSSASFSYTIETIGGTLGEIPTQAKVYPILKPTPGLLSLERAKRKAAPLGFPQEPQALSDTLYLWTSPPSSKPKILQMDIASEQLEYKINYLEDPQLLSARPDSVDQAISDAKSFLNRLGLLGEDLTEEKITFEYKKIQGGKLVRTFGLSDANFVLVNFFREDLDDEIILSQDPEKANIWVLVSGARESDRRIAHVSYNYLKIVPEQSGTYPLKQGEQVFEELKKGGGFVLKSPPEGVNITIRNIYLAYLESFKYQPYLQPVVIFEGDGPFMAAVPVVSSEWIKD